MNQTLHAPLPAGRIAALDRIVAHMKAKGGAWFATRRQIAEHWTRRFG